MPPPHMSTDMGTNTQSRHGVRHGYDAPLEEAVAQEKQQTGKWLGGYSNGVI